MSIFNPQVICCGHAAYDLNFMMNQFPQEDQKYKVDELIQTSGGPASNAASLLSAWGVETAYAGLLGDDLYGRLILDELKASGVDISLVQLDPTKNTPVSTVIVNKTTGSRTLLNRRDAADQPMVTPGTVEKLKPLNPDVLHFDGHAFDLSLKMIELFPLAKVVVDAGSYREATDRLCAAADFAICSRRYAEECTGLDDIISKGGRQHCIKLLGEKYPGRIIVTLGAGGLFYGDREVRSMKTFSVEAVDSTGAGDIFHAAFSYSLLNKFTIEESLRLSSAAAALSVTRPGGRTSIPGLEDSLRLAGLKNTSFKTDD